MTINTRNQWLFETPFLSEVYFYSNYNPYFAKNYAFTNPDFDQEYYTAPKFGRAIPLKIAPIHSDIVRAKKGLYKIFKGKALIYNGQSSNLSQRLKSHRECLTSHKIDIKDYTVQIAPLPRSTEKSRKAREQVERNKNPIALKHQRKTV